MSRRSGAANSAGTPFAAQQSILLRRTGALAESMPRILSEMSGNMAALVSGTPLLTAVALKGGVAYSHVAYKAGTTAAGTPTNQWAFIADSAFAVVKLGTDKLTAAWAANAEQSFDFVSAFTPGADAMYYIGLVVVATSVPTLDGLLFSGSAGNNEQDLTPSLARLGNVGQTVPGSLPGTITPSGFTRAYPYLWLS